FVFLFFFQAEDGIRDRNVTGVQTCALPICLATVVLFLLSVPTQKTTADSTADHDRRGDRPSPSRPPPPPRRSPTGRAGANTGCEHHHRPMPTTEIVLKVRCR